MTASREFSEVGHCGGKLTVTVVTAPDGNKQYQLGYSNSSLHAAGFCCLVATFDGEPISFTAMGGWSSEPNTANFRGIMVLLGSDKEGMYGHQCPRCKNYWRTDG